MLTTEVKGMRRDLCVGGTPGRLGGVSGLIQTSRIVEEFGSWV